MKTAAELGVGESSRLAGLNLNMATGARLMALGFLPGSRIQLVCVAPLGDPITIKIEGQSFSLRRKDARAMILIEEKSSQ